MIRMSLWKRKSHTEQDQANREIVPVRRRSSWPGTDGCSGRCQQLHCYATKARGKKMQWLQKAKITVMYCQDIMLDGNNLLISLSSIAHPAHPAPFTFQADLAYNIYCLHTYINIQTYITSWRRRYLLDLLTKAGSDTRSFYVGRPYVCKSIWVRDKK